MSRSKTTFFIVSIGVAAVAGWYIGRQTRRRERKRNRYADESLLLSISNADSSCCSSKTSNEMSEELESVDNGERIFLSDSFRSQRLIVWHGEPGTGAVMASDLASSLDCAESPRDLSRMRPDQLFAKNRFGRRCVHLIMIPSTSKGLGPRWLQELFTWLRKRCKAVAEETGMKLEHFTYLLLGYVSNSGSSSMINCATALDLDYLMLSAGCQRLCALHIVDQGCPFSINGYVKALQHTFGYIVEEKRSQCGIFYGTWSNTSKFYAYELRELLRHELPELDPDVVGLHNISIDEIQANYSTGVFLISDYANTQPPPAMMNFWNSLLNDRRVRRERLWNLSFSVIGFDDHASHPESFCKVAADLELLLMACGACRIIPLATCDSSLGQQSIQFRVWAESSLIPTIRRHIDIPIVRTPQVDPWASALIEKTGATMASHNVAGKEKEETGPPALPIPDSSSTLRKVLILYGTQSGTAERFAAKLDRLVPTTGLVVTSSRQNIENYFTHRAEESFCDQFLIFVVSTYGDGDPPESCAEFYHMLCTDTQLQERFRNSHYSIVALGNSAYPSFCGFGNKLNKQLRQCGAKRVLGMLKLDDSSDMEFTLMQWFESQWIPIAQSIFRKTDASALLYPRRADESIASEFPEFILMSPEQFAIKKADLVTNLAPCSALSRDIFRSSSHFEMKQCRLLGDGHSSAPLSKKNYEVTVQNTEIMDESIFHPGGIFAFYPEMNEADANWLLQYVFTWQGEPAAEVEAYHFVFTQCGSSVPWPQGLKVREVVTTLTNFGETPAAEWLQEKLVPLLPVEHPYRSSPSSSNIVIKNVPLTLLETLKMVYSEQAFQLPLTCLFVMRRQNTRSYTIASAIDHVSQTFQVVISEVHVDRDVKPEMDELGVKSRLYGSVSAMLQRVESTGITLRIRGLGQKSSFDAVSWQCSGVWVASGSGVAPFLGFIEERRRHGVGSFGSNVLFFGCRTSHPRDFVGRNIILNAVRDHLLEAAFFAFSREPEYPRAYARPGLQETLGRTSPASISRSDRVYVQTRIADEADLVLQYLTDPTTKLFICGGVEMGKAALNTVSDILSPISLEHRVIMEVW